MDLTIKPARPDDEPFMAPLIDAADGGIPLQIWAMSPPLSEEPWVPGTLQVRIDDAFVFWRQTWIACVSGRRAGLLLGYALPKTLGKRRHERVTPRYQPLVDMENQALGTWHIEFLAVARDMQGKRVGTALLRHAERQRGPKGLSLIVSDDNVSAVRLYQRNGYSETARRRIVKDDPLTPGEEWILMRTSQ